MKKPAPSRAELLRDRARIDFLERHMLWGTLTKPPGGLRELLDVAEQQDGTPGCWEVYCSTCRDRSSKVIRLWDVHAAKEEGV